MRFWLLPKRAPEPITSLCEWCTTRLTCAMQVTRDARWYLFCLHALVDDFTRRGD